MNLLPSQMTTVGRDLAFGRVLLTYTVTILMSKANSNIINSHPAIDDGLPKG